MLAHTALVDSGLYYILGHSLRIKSLKKTANLLVCKNLYSRGEPRAHENFPSPSESRPET